MSAAPVTSAAADQIYYPESDHMGESGLQKWVCDLAFGLLRSFFAETQEHPMLVGGNQFFYLRQGDVDLRIAPDVYVIEDEMLPLTAVRSWKLWEHEGKGPALAIEVVSDEYEKDYDPAQLAKYQQLGVRELVRYDPEFSQHPRALKFGPRRLLTHWVRTEAGLLVEWPLFSKRSAKSTLYDFWYVHEGHRNLRLGVGPEGRSLWPTQEEARRAEAEGRRAEAERANREAERAGKEAERAGKEAERAGKEAERAGREAERASRAEAELERLRAELERLKK